MKVIKERKWKYRGALKNAIARYLQTHKGADQLDVADAMRIDLKESSAVMHEMVSEGRIKVMPICTE